MKISKGRFDNVKKQVAQMVDKKEIIINDDYITLWGINMNMLLIIIR